MKERLLTNIEPKEFFRYFEDLTYIPRGSENEKEVSDYLVDFAKEHGLEWTRDEAYNVLIRKPAYPGYEDHPGVIMQAHVDMVTAKKPGSDFNFETDPIVFRVDGDKIIADETTLGADDGSGVAVMLAVLADPELKHPEIEALFTTIEEIGLFGVEKVDFSQLKGHYVLNIDAADEGVAVIGCAGGDVICSKLPITKVPICAAEGSIGEGNDCDADSNTSAPTAKNIYKISIFGLGGGHSGEDIHRGRASANKQMARVLTDLAQEMDYDLCSFRGGDKTNAIPRTAEAVIAVNAGCGCSGSENNIDKLQNFVKAYDVILKSEYHKTDAGISLKIEELDLNSKEAKYIYTETVGSDDGVSVKQLQAFDNVSKQRLLDFINFSDFGVQRMDQDFPHLVESSVNMGVVRTRDDHLECWFAVRSSRDSQAKLMGDKIRRLTAMLGGTAQAPAGNPPWPVDLDSKILGIYEDVYTDLFDREPERMIIHAALEPCKIAPRIDRKLDMIALGPDIAHPHAPGEYMTISSCRRLWATIKELLARL